MQMDCSAAYWSCVNNGLFPHSLSAWKAFRAGYDSVDLLWAFRFRRLRARRQRRAAVRLLRRNRHGTVISGIGRRHG